MGDDLTQKKHSLHVFKNPRRRYRSIVVSIQSFNDIFFVMNQGNLDMLLGTQVQRSGERDGGAQ